MSNMISVDREIFWQVLAKQHCPLLLDKMERIPLSIDSRTVPEHGVFFALAGELHDGHDFVVQAHAEGALCAVVKKGHPKISALNPENLIEVDDPLTTFSELARLHIKSMPAIKIALTGSNGKTTTKEMLKAALGALVGPAHVFASPGNKNNHIGLPLSAFQLNIGHRYAIFEMGMNHAHEIAHLCQIVEPHYGLITNISFAHEGNFSDGIDGVQKAKAELFDALSPHGHVAVNLDDPRIVSEAKRREFLSTTTFGWAQGAEVRIVEAGAYDEGSGQQKVTLELEAEESISFEVPLPGLHHAMNAASALALIKALNLDVQKAASGIAHMTQTSGRMNLIKSPRGFTIVNDGYNANPSSMTAGILAVQSLAAERLIAVIGAMGELGASSRQHHFQLGQLLAVHFDRLFICGPSAEPVVEGARSAGYPEERIIFLPTSIDLIKPLIDNLEKGDVVFIKGSLSAKMEIIAQALSELN